MGDLDVDVLVIGWGKAGKTLAGALGRAGKRVAVVEQSVRMHGGSCININCVPTKALIHHAANRPDDAPPEEWFAHAIAARDSLTGKLRAANHAMLAKVDTVTLLTGQARFVGPRVVEVGAGTDVFTVGAETVIINTGTVPARPEIDGAADSPRVFDSTGLQHVDPLPRRLAIVGGGHVGLEFAGMFAGFGSDVTILARGTRFLPREDRDVAETVEEALTEQGVTIRVGADVTSIRDTGDAAIVSFGDEELKVDAVLLATGRSPATAGLHLDAAGIASDDDGYVVVDEFLRTNVPGVFAVGDVNGGPQFTHISYDDHRIVLQQVTGVGRRNTRDRVAVPTTTFLTPPLARVGLNEREAGRRKKPYLLAAKPVAEIAVMPRPKIVGQTRGLIKVLIDPDTDHILGATLFCVDAQELVNLIALAMRTGTTASELRDGIWTHPSTTEALNEVLAIPR